LNSLKILFILFFSAAFSLFAQTKIKFSDFDMNIGIDDKDNVGKDVYIRKRDGSNFQKGKFILEENEDGYIFTMLFEINDSGIPIGTIEGKYQKHKYRFTLKSKTIDRFDVRDLETNQLVLEEFRQNDSIITNQYYFNKKIAKKIEYLGKVIYENTCRYDSIGLKKAKYRCRIKDETKGEEVTYEGEKIVFKHKWKNLPNGISQKSERYEDDGTIQITTIYTNGNSTEKTVKKDGSYEILTITNGEHIVEEFSKNGKLINKYVPTYPMANPNN
jgi:hypothetical protein